MPEVLNGALHTRDYNSIKSPLVTNNISKIPGKKGQLFAEGVVHEVKREVSFRNRKLKGCCPGINLGGWKFPREWQRRHRHLGAALAVAGRWGVVVEAKKWCLLATLGITGPSGFNYEFRALESALLSSMNPEEKNLAPS